MEEAKAAFSAKATSANVLDSLGVSGLAALLEELGVEDASNQVQSLFEKEQWEQTRNFMESEFIKLP